MKIFDGHADIWYDVAEKRKLGEENIVKKYHYVTTTIFYVAQFLLYKI